MNISKDNIKKYCERNNINDKITRLMEDLSTNPQHNIKKIIKKNSFIKEINITNHDYLPLAIKYFSDYCQNFAKMSSIDFNKITDMLHKHNKEDVRKLEEYFHKAESFWWKKDKNGDKISKKIQYKMTPDNKGSLHTEVYNIYYKNLMSRLYKLIFTDVRNTILGQIGEDYIYSRIKMGIRNYNHKYQLSSNLNNSYIQKDKNLYCHYSNDNKNNNNQIDILVVNAGGIFIFEVKTLGSQNIRIDNNGNLTESTHNKRSKPKNIKKQAEYHKKAIKNAITPSNKGFKKTGINDKFIHSKIVLVKDKDSKYTNNSNSKILNNKNCVSYMVKQSRNAILNPQQIHFIITNIRKNEHQHEDDLSKQNLSNDTGIKHKKLIENNESIITKLKKYIRILAAWNNLQTLANSEPYRK